MYVTILDTITGKTKSSHWHSGKDDHGFYWSEGGGSCDCNRAIAIGGWRLYEKQRAALGVDESRCLGCHRFVVADVHGEIEYRTKEEFVQVANESYSERLQEIAKIWYSTNIKTQP